MPLKVSRHGAFHRPSSLFVRFTELSTAQVRFPIPVESAVMEKLNATKSVWSAGKQAPTAFRQRAPRRSGYSGLRRTPCCCRPIALVAAIFPAAAQRLRETAILAMRCLDPLAETTGLRLRRCHRSKQFAIRRELLTTPGQHQTQRQTSTPLQQPCESSRSWRSSRHCNMQSPSNKMHRVSVRLCLCRRPMVPVGSHSFPCLSCLQSATRCPW
jgi:hypothetical protein